MNLFELSAKYQQVMDSVLREDELSQEQMDAVLSLNDSLEEKILNYTSIIKTLEADAKAIAEQVEAMEKRAASRIKKAKWLKEVIKDEMAKCEKKNIENEFHSVTLCQNNPKVDDYDHSMIPDEFWKKKVKESLELSKTDILKALKDNIPVPGARLVRDYRVTIR